MLRRNTRGGVESIISGKDAIRIFLKNKKYSIGSITSENVDAITNPDVETLISEIIEPQHHLNGLDLTFPVYELQMPFEQYLESVINTNSLVINQMKKLPTVYKYHLQHFLKHMKSKIKKSEDETDDENEQTENTTDEDKQLKKEGEGEEEEDDRKVQKKNRKLMADSTEITELSEHDDSHGYVTFLYNTEDKIEVAGIDVDKIAGNLDINFVNKFFSQFDAEGNPPAIDKNNPEMVEKYIEIYKETIVEMQEDIDEDNSVPIVLLPGGSNNIRVNAKKVIKEFRNFTKEFYETRIKDTVQNIIDVLTGEITDEDEKVKILREIEAENLFEGKTEEIQMTSGFGAIFGSSKIESNLAKKLKNVFTSIFDITLLNKGLKLGTNIIEIYFNTVLEEIAESDFREAINTTVYEEDTNILVKAMNNIFVEYESGSDIKISIESPFKNNFERKEGVIYLMDEALIVFERNFSQYIENLTRQNFENNPDKSKMIVYRDIYEEMAVFPVTQMFDKMNEEIKNIMQSEGKPIAGNLNFFKHNEKFKSSLNILDFFAKEIFKKFDVNIKNFLNAYWQITLNNTSFLKVFVVDEDQMFDVQWAHRNIAYIDVDSGLFDNSILYKFFDDPPVKEEEEIDEIIDITDENNHKITEISNISEDDEFRRQKLIML